MDTPTSPAEGVAGDYDSAIIEDALQQALGDAPQRPPPTPEEEAYEALVAAGRSRDWAAFDALELVYVSGRDPLGRPVVVVVASRLPAARAVDYDDLLLYFVHVLDPVVRTDYVLVYVACDLAHKPSLAWLRKAYTLLGRKVATRPLNVA